MQCAEDDSFCCYFGETQQPVGRRIQQHFSNSCSRITPLRSTTQFPTIEHKRAEIAKVIAAGVDPDEILRDWFAHVTDRGLHPGQQRISVVDIISHPFLRKNRERVLVAEHMFENGDFHYLGMGRGCLNTYADN